MLKKLLGLIAILIITVVAIINVRVDMKNNSMSDLSVANVEALAENESNPWYLWLIYGLTKDEESYDVECEWNYEINLGVVKWGSNGKGKKQMCKDGGSDNCWVGECKAE